MKEITSVSAKDTGRIVVSEDGFYEVVFISLTRVDQDGNIYAMVESKKT